MFRNRIILTILTVVMFSAAAFGQQAAANNLPTFGKWTYAGKDNAGVDWKGTLTVSKLDPDRFNTEKYQCMCAVEAESAKTSKGVEAPCKYDPAARALSFSTGVDTTITYTAVLSPDGKTLNGKWTETKEADRRTKQPASVVGGGEWTATFGGK